MSEDKKTEKKDSKTERRHSFLVEGSRKNMQINISRLLMKKKKAKE